MEYPFPPPAEVPFSARAAITSLYVIALLEMAALLAYACRWLRPQWRHAAVWALSAVVIIVSAPALATDPRPMPDAVPWPLVTAVVPLALLGLVVATVQLSSLNPVLPYEAAILALVSVIFLVPPVKTVHRAARRAQCRNNLKQIGLGMHQFHDRHGVLPPAVSGNPAVSWRVNLLPHTDYSELHRRYDPHGSWDTPSNLSLANETVSLYAAQVRFGAKQKENSIASLHRMPCSSGQRRSVAHRMELASRKSPMDCQTAWPSSRHADGISSGRSLAMLTSKKCRRGSTHRGANWAIRTVGHRLGILEVRTR